MENNGIIIVKEARLTLWQSIVAIVCLAAFFFFIIKGVYQFIHDSKQWIVFLLLGCLAMNFAIMFALLQRFKFDFKSKRYTKQYCFGPFIIGISKMLPNIEYISVFKQFSLNEDGDRSYCSYKVNLWYEKNRHFTVYWHADREMSLNVAARIAAELNLGLLDATVPDDKKWIELMDN